MKKLLLRRLLLLMACMLTSIQVVFGQTPVTVKGTVSDADGQPLIGAYVMPKDQNTGVTTDLDGKFSIVVPRGTTLVVSSIGFITQELTAAPTLNIVMEEDISMIEETVVQAVRRAGLPPGQGPGPADPPAHG